MSGMRRPGGDAEPLNGDHLLRDSRETPLEPLSRGSPDLGMTEIRGQLVDPTSGLAFLHRAWKRLSNQQDRLVPEAEDAAKSSESQQLQLRAGDNPFTGINARARLLIPDREACQELVTFYFDVCIATYRFLHRPTVDRWLEKLLQNIQDGLPLEHEFGGTKAAILLVVLAIAIFHKGKSKGSGEEASAMRDGDQLFATASHMVDTATGFPGLDSVQARLVQVLYLLHTSRMNQAWYVLGSAMQITAALGLHRRSNRARNLASKKQSDYINSQCRKRTFWVAYILDHYLGVIFGRPRHYHDEDIDQDLPACINDEDMTLEGPKPGRSSKDCPIDSLVFHAR